MKRIHIVGFALVAVFALSAMLASAAFAEETLLAEWLENQNPIPAATDITTSGEILLEDDKVPLVGKVAVVCNGSLDGTVGPGAADEITEVLNLEELLVETNLKGTALLCKTQTECESSTTDIEVWPVDLPWPTEVYLMADGQYLDLIEDSGYEVKCLIGGLTVEDECTAEDTNLLVENGAKGAVTPAGSVAEPSATCTEGGKEAGINETVTAAEPLLSNGDELELSSVE